MEKSLLSKVIETIEQHRAERRQQRAFSPPAMQSSRPLARFLRWLVPNGGTILAVLALVLTQQVWARPLQQQVNVPGPSATTVNYQGRLADPLGNPLDGSYAMSFSLWDALSAGNLIWGPENHPAVPVSGGLFSVGLGSQTSGGIPTTVWDVDRYLEIAVGGETLSPRELIRSVPIAGMALTVPDGAIGLNQLASEVFAQSVQNPEVHWTVPVVMDGSTYKPIADFAVTVSVTKTSLVLLVASSPIEFTGSPGFLFAGFQRNGVQIGRTHRYQEPVVNGEIWSWNYAEQLAPGTYTYRLEAKGVIGMSISWYRPSVSLIAIPVRP